MKHLLESICSKIDLSALQIDCKLNVFEPIDPHARYSDKSYLSFGNDMQCWHFTGGSYLKTELWKSENGNSGGPTLNGKRHFDATPLKDDRRTQHY